MLPCPADKILNPATKRCVLRTGAIGKKLVAKEKADGKRLATTTPNRLPAASADPCPADKILNPATKRCVLRTGAIGKKLVAKEKADGKRPANGSDRTVTSRAGLKATRTGEKNAKGLPIVEVKGAKYAWIEATKNVVPRTVATGAGKTYLDTGTKNALGRPIVAGPKGGGYAWVEETKTVTKIGKTAPRPPSSRPRPPPAAVVAPRVEWRGTPVKLSYPKIRAQYSNSLGSRNLPFEPLVEKMNRVVSVFDVAPADASNDVKRTVEKVSVGNVVATRQRNMDLGWLQKQTKFMSELSVYDLMTVIGYTVRSHEWLGPFQRRGKLPTARSFAMMNTHIAQQPVPLFPQFRAVCKNAVAKDVFKSAHKSDAQKTFLGSDSAAAYKAYVILLKDGAFRDEILGRAIALFAEDLKRIIARAPPLDAPMIVYRGTAGDVFERKDGGRGRVYHIDAFSSAALDFGWALVYARDRDGKVGMVQRITIAPGTCILAAALVNLWNANGEYEVILPMGTYEVGKPSQRLVTSGGRTFYKKVTEVTFRGDANMTPDVVM